MSAPASEVLADVLAIAAERDRLTEADRLLRELVGPDAVTAAHRAWTDRIRDSESGRGRLVNMADVEPETVRWLWRARIPLGKLTIFDGDPGVLKSTATLDITARLSRAAPMPDGSHSDVDGPRGTVLLTAEDGLADTIRPRLDAAGADAARVVALKAVATEDGERLPTVDDLDALRDAIEAVDAALVVVDPLVAYLGAEVNSYRDQDVRAALAGLAELADELGVAVVAVRHLNKSGGDNPLHRGGGSIGLIAAARSGLLVARDPEEPDGERRILATTKCNLAPEPPALAFRPKVVDGVVAVAWEGETKHAARDLLTTSTSEERTAREEAADYLRQRLRDGPAPVEELRRKADDLGVSWRTMRRAKQKVGAKHDSIGFGADKTWWWRLPGHGAWPPKADSGVAYKANGPEPRGKRGDGRPYAGQPPDVAEIGGPDDLQTDLDAALDGGE